jgi:putative flippase GtrA
MKPVITPGRSVGTIGRLGRWATFNGVGLAGVVVQLAVLAALTQLADLPIALATAIAVEAAVLHNFVWHQHVTWRDRKARDGRDVLARLGRFHALNGGISLAGNIVMTSALVSSGFDPLLSNLAAIILCSSVNFLAGDRLVFAGRSIASFCLAAGLLVSHPAATTAASPEENSALSVSGPSAAALAAWDKYVAAVDARHSRSSPKDFFALDIRGVDKWREQAKRGNVPMVDVDPPGAPDAKIHHWAGGIYVPNITVDAVVKRLQDYAGRESEFYTEVKASRLIERDGNRVRVFLRLERGAYGVSATLNTEHSVEYRRLGETRAVSRSVATKVAELQNVGRPNERERAPGSDRGFLWRLNAYWRFEQAGDGVLIECESVSLSREVPLLARLFVSRAVDAIARESLERTLRALRAFLIRGA